MSNNIKSPKQLFEVALPLEDINAEAAEGMRLLLISSVAQRLTGKDGDSVIQLQTNFGGGKTHTLLAVYHLSMQA